MIDRDERLSEYYEQQLTEHALVLLSLFEIILYSGWMYRPNVESCLSYNVCARTK
jgi:hypothetical protein